MITLKSWVAGEWRAGDGKPQTLVNPATEEPVAETSTQGIDLGRVLSYAKDRGGPVLRGMGFAERGAVLKAMSKALHDAREPLIEASVINAGTTRGDAKFDVDGAIATLSYYAELGTKLGNGRFVVEGEGEQLGRGARFFGRHVRVPLPGVALQINAFNFPAWGLAEKAATAILAGVPVITKPATSTALTAYLCVERIAPVMPEGALQLLCGSAGDLTSRLGPGDALAFTGSGSTGAMLRALEPVVARSVRVNVEADSLNATVLGLDVSGDETYDAFLRDAVREITQKTGQKCTATRRIFVPAAMMSRVIDDLGERLAAIVVGDPSLAEVRMGPLATADQLRDAKAGLAKLEASGAKRVFGDLGKVTPTGIAAGKGYFVAPVILRADDPHAAHAVHSHEVFAPVATIMPYGSAAEAAALVARGEGGLVASIYTDDIGFLEEAVIGIAPWTGRVLAVSRKVADQAISPGLVLPSCVHGGPGRAGGGEELGGERGLAFYTQRTALQGDRAMLSKFLDR